MHIYKICTGYCKRKETKKNSRPTPENNLLIEEFVIPRRYKARWGLHIPNRTHAAYTLIKIPIKKFKKIRKRERKNPDPRWLSYNSFILTKLLA